MGFVLSRGLSKKIPTGIEWLSLEIISFAGPRLSPFGSNTTIQESP
jgi:hypothetical protein